MNMSGHPPGFGNLSQMVVIVREVSPKSPQNSGLEIIVLCPDMPSLTDEFA